MAIRKIGASPTRSCSQPLMGGAMAAWIVVPLALAAWRFRP
jgi:hypothetical protein